ncbi:methyl-accepting chemotaxis protein [Paenibacillus sp. CAU 1782]
MKMTISKKLYLGFSAILLLLAISSVTNGFQMLSVERTYQDLLSNEAASVSYVKDLSLAVKDEELSINSFIASGDIAHIEQYRLAVKNYNRVSALLQSLIEDRDKWQILQGLDLLQQQYTSNIENMIEYKLQGREETYLSLLATNEPIIQKFRETAGRFVELQAQELDEKTASVEQQVHGTQLAIILLSVISLLIGAGIAYWIASNITKPVKILSRASEKIASGDLTGENIAITTKDEIAVLSTAFNNMTANLRNLITKLTDSAQHVAASSQELTAGAEHTTKATEQVVGITEQVSAGSQEQMEKINESMGFVGGLTIEAGQIAEKSLSVSQQSQYAADVSREGNNAVATVIEQMNQIQHTVEDIAGEVSRLGERSKEIGEIVAVISDISSQTNLLALNAAIEAARAGEAGRGFAVVATEIRKLADQSAGSSKQIVGLVQSIQQDTAKTIASVQNGIAVVESGKSAVAAAGSSFDSIQNAVQSVSEQIQTVSDAAQNMSANTEILVQAINTIQKIADETSSGTISVSAATQEQLATMEQIASSSGNLTKMSEELLELVGSFKV